MQGTKCLDNTINSWGRVLYDVEDGRGKKRELEGNLGEGLVLCTWRAEVPVVRF